MTSDPGHRSSGETPIIEAATTILPSVDRELATERAMVDLEEQQSTIATRADGKPDGVSLPVMAAPARGVRPSRMSRWRAVSLTLVHVLILIHIGHWLITGRTLSPVEPSETMYTLNEGHLNAGFLFFAASILATLIFGRFVCGWGCHFIAYQDLCTWLLKKIRIKPKAFRSRLPVFAPLALAAYMFVWPTAYRWWSGIPYPTWENHLIKTAFWETFPGFAVGALTFLLAGFVIVYFLGSKGFCTYACPYGGFFALADKVAPGRILVNDSCQHSGHCTASCSSNVRVSEEVAKYGMVVDPGCMKCLDCVSVCPNDALSFGFGKPSVGTVPITSNKRSKYDFTLVEELCMLVVGIGSLLALRGLYGQIPLLLAMALAAMTGFGSVKLWHMVLKSNVRFQNLQLKRGARWTRSGIGLAVAFVVWLAFVTHSGAVQYAAYRGHQIKEQLALPDSVWHQNASWWQNADDLRRKSVQGAVHHLEWADRFGLMGTVPVLQDLVWLYLAKDDLDVAERTVRRIAALAPEAPEAHRGLGNVLRRAGDLQGAEKAYRRALALDTGFDVARIELCGLLREAGRHEDAAALYAEAIAAYPAEERWPLDLARLRLDLGDYAAAEKILIQLIRSRPDSARAAFLMGVVGLQSGDATLGIGYLRRAIELDPELADAHYNLGLALLGRQAVEEAIAALRESIRLRPEFALAHYNLAVAIFMSGAPAEALPSIHEAIRLNPRDADAYGFLSVVLREVGDGAGARAAAKRAAELQQGTREP